MAIAAPRRRAHRDEDRVGLRHRVLEIETEIEPSRRGIARYQLVKAGLVDRDFAALEGSDLSSILVYASDLMAKIREAGAGNQPDVPRSNHDDAHSVLAG